MGNFGKRLLIILLAVTVIVALAVGGNAYQNRNKNHKVSKENAVVYEGQYNNVSYKVTKGDVWKTMLYSSPMSTINEIIDKQLLKSYIDAQSAEAVAQEIEYLIYGSNDQAEINKIKADQKKDEQLKQSFYNKLYVLGYKQGGEAGHTIEDYAKLMLAYGEYAKYRLENGLKIGSLEPKLDDETLKTALESEKKDTFAITIRFNSEKEATEFYKEYKLAVVSSNLKKYVGDSKYVCAKNEDGSYYLDQDLNPVLLEVEVEENGVKKTVNVPNLKELQVTDNNYVWDETRPAWEYEGEQYHFVFKSDVKTDDSYAGTTYDATTATSAVVAFEDVESFYASTSSMNTAVLSNDNFVELYIEMYNDYYALQRTKLPSHIKQNPIAAFAGVFGFTLNGGLLSAEDVAKLNAALKLYNLVVVEWEVEGQKFQEIRKYVGNDEYVVAVEDGIAQSKNGFATYKKSNGENVPNYKILVDENDNPVLDKDNNFQYVLDENGDRIANDSKKDIKDQTEFTRANTIEPSAILLYAALCNLYVDYEYEYAQAYADVMESIKEFLLFNYEELNAKRSDVAKQIFTTLTFEESATGGYLTKATSMTAANSSETPYYMILKLGSSSYSDITDAQIQAYKEKKISNYIKTANLPQMAAAELRKEAGLQLFDEYFGYEYASILNKSDDTNQYGVSDSSDYYKVKGYNNKVLAKTTKVVKVNDQEIAKIKVTADELYAYSMEQSGSSYLSNAIINKVLLSMKDFETIHGKSRNYLTSKNWKMKEYAEATQSYNYAYEYYKSMYAQYGIDYYDSVNEFLYAYGSRSFDDMVLAFERTTMRNVFLYNALVGDLFENKNGYVSNLSSYSLTSTDPTVEGSTDKYLFGGDKFKDLYEDFFSANVFHVLFYVDFNEDGSPDDYDEFIKSFDENGNHKYLKQADGQTPLTLTDWEALVSQLLDQIYDYVNTDSSWSSSSISLSSFITKYNESSLKDGDYKDYKKVGLQLEFESLGEVTNFNVTNYVERFGEGVKKVYAKLEKVDKDLLGYSLADELTQTEFGLHLIFETAGTNYNKPTFKYTDNNDNYSALLKNENDEVSEAQIALYILRAVYTNIFGDTDNPEKNAGFNYPNIPSELDEAFSLYFESYINTMLDSSSSYHSNYIMLNQLASESSDYQQQFKELRDIYYSMLFGILA